MSLDETNGARPTLRWTGGVDGHLQLIDQTLLPVEVLEIACRDVETVFEAIRSLRVRGAPAIGVAAAYGVCIAAQGNASASAVIAQALVGINRLAESRPTAVNLFWALER